MRFIFCLLLIASVGTQPVRAEEAVENPAVKFSKMMPNTTIDGFAPTPIPGLFEVTAGDQIFYFSPTGHLVFGEIWTSDGRSLTGERREQVVGEKLNRLPLQKALTIGNGSHQIIEFTDPDCPFCRKLDAFLAKRTDVTRHVYFYPLEGLHPKAADKARFIVCSEDQGKTLKEVYSGKWDNMELPPLADSCEKTLLDEHRQLGGMLGVRGTPSIWVDGIRINGADLDAITALLDQPTKE